MFGNEPDLSVEQCRQVLERHMPDHIKERKISQKMFIGYDFHCNMWSVLDLQYHQAVAAEVIFVLGDWRSQ